MSKIVLITAPRKTTVSRSAVRKAVASAFEKNTHSVTEKHFRVVKKRVAKKAAKKS